MRKNFKKSSPTRRRLTNPSLLPIVRQTDEFTDSVCDLWCCLSVWIAATLCRNLIPLLLISAYGARSSQFILTTMKSESDGSSFSIEYEVFLSFRGSDVRQTFADCLHSCLVRSKIRTFRDEEKLRKGENIGASLIQAITESKIYIPILTQNYASSKWCLQELAKMVDCWKTGGGKEQHIILPVFYFVDPRDVRHHDSGPYKEAFEQHCLKHDPQTVLEWKEALQEVGQMKGWHVTESDGQGAVIDKIFAEVESHLRASYALVTDELVGIDFHVEEVMRLLSLDSHSASEKIVGIHGMGGLGKTTLAKAVYNKVSMQFDHCCFLENIRETLSKNDGELTLQNRIISEILPSDSKPARDVSDGIRIIRERVRRYRLLIVLDDVDERFQFQNIFGKLGDFSMDSRFLITTRDARVLELLQECKVYATEGMSYDHALKLFSKHALGTDCPSEGYASLSEEFVKVAAGLPLALKVIGSLLFHTDKGYWEAKLTELKKIPPAKVQERLKISYDELTHNEKQVFLDVACLFVGVNKDAPIYMWSDCDFYPASTVRTLVQRSLIRINEKDQFWMHDHVRDLGRAIVCEENNQNPYKRSRIWSNRDAINMLKSREGTDCVEVLRVDMKGEDFVLTVKEFKQFSRLRYLEVLNGRLAGNFKGILPCIRWLRLYRCKSFPTGLNLQKMAVLNLEDCSVRDDWSGWNEIKAASKLKAVNLSLCRDLEQVPDLSNCRGLELLDFYGCQKMQGELDIGNWENLRVLAVNCTLITKLKGEIKLLQNLRKINASHSGLVEMPAGISKLSSLEALNLVLFHPNMPDFTEMLPNGLKTLALSSSYIPALPSSLKTLDLSLSRDLHTLPSLSNLTTLTVLRLHCVGIHEIPGLGDLKLLATLDIVSSSNLGNLDGLENLVLLEELIVETCDRLKTLPSLASLTKLHKLQIKSCWALKEVHGVGELRESLSHLDMRGRLTLTGIDALHSIKKLETLSLMALEFTRTSLTSSLISLSMFTKLRRLTIIHESYLSDRQQSSKSSLKQFPHLSSMKNLRELAIIYCVDLVKRNARAMKSVVTSSKVHQDVKPNSLIPAELGLPTIMKSESDGSLFSIEYEVFLSFRGLDVRQTFADCLHSCLVRSKIRTFRDEEKLRIGENIGASLIQAITESRIYIPILTQNYASSKWCLQELAKMVDCWKTGGGRGKEQHIILPVFYLVDPRDVRHHDSGPYKEAFEQHCLKHDSQTVLEWREALEEVGKMKGWHVTESDGQGAVIDKIFAKVESHLRADYALVTDELVGIDSHVEEVTRLLNLDSHSAGEKIVGIHGMGGLGKTTLAKAVYNKVSMQFEHCCFLENIRETLSKNDGELTLQNRIISDILQSDSKPAKDVSDGIRVMRERVCRYKLLIVLDDVDEKFQFSNILGKLGDFSMDSRFLITTRDARVLEQKELLPECKVYATEGMSNDHALTLFSKHALGTDCPSEGYAVLSKEFVKVARAIVYEENNPYKRSRIWSDRDAINMLKSREGTDCVEVLRVDMEGEYFVLTDKEFKQFSKLRYLEVLNGRLAGNFKGILPCVRWLRLYRCKSFPTGLNLQKMAVLNLEDCSVRDDWSGWNEIKAASKLKAVNLSSCRYLEQVPDLSNCRGLELLDFYGCQEMQGELDIGNWENLRVLAVNCTLITKLKGEIKLLRNLRKINASHSGLVEMPAGISKLSSLEALNLVSFNPNMPDFTEMLPNGLKTLALSSSYIPALPSSLKTLDLSLSKDLHTLPSLSNLTTLTVLRLHCVGIHEIPGLGDLKLLATLDIVGASNLGNLAGLENLVLLEELIVENCDRLKTLPSLASLTKLHKLQIKSCWALNEVHGVGRLRESLSHLDMSGRLTLTGIDALHSMKKLETLSLMALEFTRRSVTSSLTSLSMFTKLRRLTIIHESYLSDRQQSSKSSLKQFPHLSSMKNLRELAIFYCVDLVKICDQVHDMSNSSLRDNAEELTSNEVHQDVKMQKNLLTSSKVHQDMKVRASRVVESRNARAMKSVVTSSKVHQDVKVLLNL
ncbi:Disease resistance protein L6 [Linum perenne]